MRFLKIFSYKNTISTSNISIKDFGKYGFVTYEIKPIKKLKNYTLRTYFFQAREIDVA